MNLPGTSISHFFPILATSHYVFSKTGHILIPGCGWVLPINLYRLSNWDFEALNLCPFVFLDTIEPLMVQDSITS